MKKHTMGITIGIAVLCLLIGFAFIWPGNAAAAASKVSKPAKPALVSVESKKVKKATVTWTPVKNVSGYEICYRTGETEKTKTVDGADQKTATLKNLLGGKEYTVKVRSFSTDKSAAQKICSDWSEEKTVTIKRSKWSDLQDKYAAKEKVNQLIFVKYKGSSKADLILYTKKEIEADADQKSADSAEPECKWEKVLSCDAYTGQNGIDKKKEGDRRTPTGVFTLDKAFGIKDDPGSKMKYIKVNKNLYWCGDRDHYNQMIDIRDYPHKCRGEHLINYTKQYAYAMNISYNKEGTYGKGSAIFLHCFGYNAYTLGCVAVSPENMKTILQTCGDNTKICIYWK